MMSHPAATMSSSQTPAGHSTEPNAAVNYSPAVSDGSMSDGEDDTMKDDREPVASSPSPSPTPAETSTSVVIHNNNSVTAQVASGPNQGGIDPAIAYLFALARNPSKNDGLTAVNETEINVRHRIMSLKVGLESRNGLIGGMTDPNFLKKGTKKRFLDPKSESAAKQNERAERRKPKKRKTMKRCTSPSHFAVDLEEEIKYGEDYTLDLPSRERMDGLLHSIVAFYYKPKETHPNQTSVWVDNEYDQTQYPTLDLLLSPIRLASARETWSNKEVALFEAGMCAYPKQFDKISRLMKTKTTQEVVKFYYTFWKHHKHYQIWKGHPGRTANAAAASSTTTKVGATTTAASSASTSITATRPPRSSPPPVSKKISTSANAAPTSSSFLSSPPGSTNPASAAHSSIPAYLESSRADVSHARIRMIDPKTGKESFFILPSLETEAATAMRDQAEADAQAEIAEEKEKAEADERSSSSPRHPGGRTERMEDEMPAPSEDEVGDEEDEEGDDTNERDQGGRDPLDELNAMDGGGGSGRRKVKSREAETRSDSPTPTYPMYRCRLPQRNDSSQSCNRIFGSTNALGAHLRGAHGIEKAFSNKTMDTSQMYLEILGPEDMATPTVRA